MVYCAVVPFSEKLLAVDVILAFEKDRQQPFFLVFQYCDVAMLFL